MFMSNLTHFLLGKKKEIWINILQLNKNKLSRWSRICCDHFDPNDLITKSGFVRLKENAKPLAIPRSSKDVKEVVGTKACPSPSDSHNLNFETKEFLTGRQISSSSVSVNELCLPQKLMNSWARKISKGVLQIEN
ncbi:uncharacterized protein [Diabrotica undecimpunctata]|uniref:uncharacterized protein n=1 Tax=Diabrotica undecimpunctata TaxID=50387 RepID=UPI003B63D5EF